jgi:hypothetical protein
VGCLFLKSQDNAYYNLTMKVILTYLAFFLISIEIYSQSYVDAAGADRFTSTRALEDFNNLKSGFDDVNDLPEDIKGTMYFESKFLESVIFLNGVALQEESLMRYNAFKDEIEIGKRKHQIRASEALIKKLTVAVQIGDLLYIPFSLDPDAPNDISYLIQIHKDNDHQLFLRKTKKFIDEKPAPSGIGGFLPARFEDKVSVYYKPAKRKVPIEIKLNKKSIYEIFSDREVELKKYIQREKIKFKDPSDLIIIFKYFNNY